MNKKGNITKKRHLEMMLQNIPPHEDPKVHLEQYTTPASIASDILWNAHALNDINGKIVADLGCGTGIFAIGAALLGAEKVIGLDIDNEVIKTAKTYASKMGVDETTEFMSGDIQSFNLRADTVIQNPPFGAQKAGTKNADRLFMKKAVETAPVIYSLHMGETEEFVYKYFKSLNGNITHKFYYTFYIPHIYHFHQKEKINIDVVVLRVEADE
ncbi:MAG: METTL5 family protein [Methanobacterium sp.]|nr:METTL5 family protein [Methanobacterium sp.]